MSVYTGAEQVPSYLRGTYDMLVAAFPNGVPEALYLPLLALLADHMSQRNVATVIALLTGKNATLVYHDILTAIAPDSEPRLEQSSIDRAKQHLMPHGYECWHTED